MKSVCSSLYVVYIVLVKRLMRVIFSPVWCGYAPYVVAQDKATVKKEFDFEGVDDIKDTSRASDDEDDAKPKKAAGE